MRFYWPCSRNCWDIKWGIIHSQPILPSTLTPCFLHWRDNLELSWGAGIFSASKESLINFLSACISGNRLMFNNNLKYRMLLLKLVQECNCATTLSLSFRSVSVLSKIVTRLPKFPGNTIFRIWTSTSQVWIKNTILVIRFWVVWTFLVDCECALSPWERCEYHFQRSPNTNA